MAFPTQHSYTLEASSCEKKKNSPYVQKMLLEKLY